MKKKILNLIMAIYLLIHCIFILSSCNFDQGHTHEYNNGICIECGEIKGLQFEYMVSSDSYKVLDGHQVIASEFSIPAIYNDGTHGEKPVTTIYASAFSYCKVIAKIEIPSSIKVIEADAFHGCSNIYEVVLCEGLETIGDYAFVECRALGRVAIPNSVKNIGVEIFGGCIALQDVVLGQNITEITDHMFNGCNNIGDIVIPNSVTRIGKYAFTRCVNMVEITIPNSLEEIDEYAFADCDSLERIHYQGSYNEWIKLENNIGEGNEMFLYSVIEFIN